MIRKITLLAILFVPALLSQTQKETPPAAGTPKEFRVPPRSTIRLSNGMQLTSIRYGQVPKVAVEVAIRTGNIDEGPDDISLSSVTADMLLEGTSSRTAQQISEQAAEMAAAYRFESTLR